MLFVLIGVGVLVCHFLGVGPMAAWEFDKAGDLLKFCVPFIAAVVWWIWSDASGLTKRRAMARDEQRKIDRRDRNIEAMGLGHLHKKRPKD
jgi:small Trp-rich protein